MATTTPTLARRTLGTMLERLRKTAGVDVTTAANHVGVVRTTIGRWERGHAAPKVGLIRALSDLYQCSPAEMTRLTALAAQSAERGIWEGAKVPPHLRALYESESTAQSIRSVELDYIPGLLQTPDYLSAMQAERVGITSDEAEAVRRVYKQRQEVMFDGTRLPRMLFVMGPSALIYLDSLPDVQASQIKRLKEVCQLPGVEVRVMTQLHAAMDGAFTVIEPGQGLLAEPFVFLESADGSRYVEDRDVVSTYQRIHERVLAKAIPLEDYLR